MAQPRFRRRKEDRPAEITDAAFRVFAKKGYAAARVAEVAEHAGVSKGLLYLYFKTKEELFKAVIKSVVMRRVDRLANIVETTELSSTAFLRGPMADFMKSIPGSRVAVVIRLLLAEAPRHPDLVDYYWQNVVSRGLNAMTRLVERGVERGEFRPTALADVPQLLLAPMMLATLWNLLFTRRPLDTDRLIDTHIDMLLVYLTPPGGSENA
ncbi:MAG: TetR/AcrR family transcriptional regulator [Woeseiaceae bacterium]|nr:TetR/AcrR family transcriptional regulator [Woeseiaceae bacterium]